MVGIGIVRRSNKIFAPASAVVRSSSRVRWRNKILLPEWARDRFNFGQASNLIHGFSGCETESPEDEMKPQDFDEHEKVLAQDSEFICTFPWIFDEGRSSSFLEQIVAERDKDKKFGHCRDTYQESRDKSNLPILF